MDNILQEFRKHFFPHLAAIFIGRNVKLNFDIPGMYMNVYVLLGARAYTCAACNGAGRGAVEQKSAKQGHIPSDNALGQFLEH